MAAQDYEQVTYNAPAGSQVGQSATEKVGFWGATPVVQASTAANLATTVFSEAKTGMWAFGSSTAAQATISRINSILTALKNAGIMASA